MAPGPWGQLWRREEAAMGAVVVVAAALDVAAGLEKLTLPRPAAAVAVERRLVVVERGEIAAASLPGDWMYLARTGVGRLREGQRAALVAAAARRRRRIEPGGERPEQPHLAAVVAAVAVLLR